MAIRDARLEAHLSSLKEMKAGHQFEGIIWDGTRYAFSSWSPLQCLSTSVVLVLFYKKEIALVADLFTFWSQQKR